MNWYKETKKKKKRKKKDNEKKESPSGKLDTQLFPNRKKPYHE